jgi:hypothetical protein
MGFEVRLGKTPLNLSHPFAQSRALRAWDPLELLDNTLSLTRNRREEAEGRGESLRTNTILDILN